MTLINGWHVPDNCPYFEKLARTNGFNYESYDRAMTFVEEVGVAIDGGAHMGSWSRKMIGDFKKVIAFEPQKENFECLKKNVPDKEVKKLNIALGAEQNWGAIISAENSGAGYIGKGLAFRIMPLDYFGFSPNFIKLDVEGFEYYALKGAEETIKRSKPVILFEDKGLEKKYYDLPTGSCDKFLTELGYTKREHINRDSIYTC